MNSAAHYRSIWKRRLWPVLVPFMAACLSPVFPDVDPAAGGGRVVISGQISTLEGRTIAEIGLTSAEGSRPEPVSGAAVYVAGNGGLRIALSDHPEIPGKYECSGCAGVPGETYHLEARMPDGRRFRSDDETMPVSGGSDQLSNEMVLEEYIDFDGALMQDPVIRIYTKPSLASGAYFRWETEEVYLIRPTDYPDPFGSVPPDCFVTQAADPQRVVLFDGGRFTGVFPEPMLVASRSLDISFFYKHYFTVYLGSITEAAYDYWTDVRSVANQTGSIFDAPPARVEGNIRGSGTTKAFGFFQASNESYERFAVQRSDLPKFAFINRWCDFDYTRPYDDYRPECLDCLSVRNSSHRRPEWF